MIDLTPINILEQVKATKILLNRKGCLQDISKCQQVTSDYKLDRLKENSRYGVEARADSIKVGM